MGEIHKLSGHHLSILNSFISLPLWNFKVPVLQRTIFSLCSPSVWPLHIGDKMCLLVWNLKSWTWPLLHFLQQEDPLHSRNAVSGDSMWNLKIKDHPDHKASASRTSQWFIYHQHWWYNAFNIMSFFFFQQELFLFLQQEKSLSPWDPLWLSYTPSPKDSWPSRRVGRLLENSIFMPVGLPCMAELQLHI